MQTNKLNPVVVLCWAGIALVVACLVIAMTLTGSVEQVGKSSAEIVQIVQHLDSSDSLKTILVTFSGQYQRAEAHWMQVLNLLLSLLFLVSLVAVGLLVTLMIRLRRDGHASAADRR